MSSTEPTAAFAPFATSSFKFPALRPTIEAALAERGEHFVPYPYGDGSVGTAWHTPAWIEAAADRAGFDTESVIEAGLDEHQDVFVLRRR